MSGAKCLVSPEYLVLMTKNRGTAADWLNV